MATNNLKIIPPFFRLTPLPDRCHICLSGKSLAVVNFTYPPASESSHGNFTQNKHGSLFDIPCFAGTGCNV